jgi:hypothetical protein
MSELFPPPGTLALVPIGHVSKQMHGFIDSSSCSHSLLTKSSNLFNPKKILAKKIEEIQLCCRSKKIDKKKKNI